MSDFYTNNDVATIEYSAEALELIVEKSARKKAHLQSLLSGIEGWSDGRVCIPIEYNREVDLTEFMRNWERLYYWGVLNLSLGTSKRKVFMLLGTFITENKVDDDLLPLFHFCGFDKARAGQKLTRLLSKYLHDTQDSRRVVENIGTALKTGIELDNWYVSIRPFDFSRMSLGNSWRSCHMVDGEYCSGAVSYMLDETTFIVYKEANGKELVSRAVGHLISDVVVFPKVYGDASGDLDVIFDTITKAIADTSGVDFYKDYEISINNRTNPDSSHYADYKYHTGHRFKFSSIIINQCNTLIGSAPLCLVCGSTHYTNDSLTCDECDDRSLCEYCNEYHHYDNMTMTADGLVCEYCLENHYIYDEIEEEYYTEDVMVFVESAQIYTHENNVVRCHYCGEYEVDSEALDTVNDELICRDCAENDYSPCEECGLYVGNGDVLHEEESDSMVCPDCYIELIDNVNKQD